MRMKLRKPWVKERVLEADFFGSTLRLYFRLRGDGSIFMAQLSDYGHTLSFEEQRRRLAMAFRIFAKEPSDAEKFTLDEFDKNFEERLKPGFRTDGGVNAEVL
jgi:hypothetical protein